jgi:hypothetical protein
VGVIVAKADDGFVLFHPMEKALKLGSSLSGIHLAME